jgi:hypothetical protein
MAMNSRCVGNMPQKIIGQCLPQHNTAFFKDFYLLSRKGIMLCCIACCQMRKYRLHFE